MNIFGQRKTAQGKRANGTLPRGKPNRHRTQKKPKPRYYISETMPQHRAWNSAVDAKKLARAERRLQARSVE